jgi:RNA polymerase primary sigma factor
MYTSLQGDPTWGERAWDDWPERELAGVTEDHDSGSIKNPLHLYFRDVARHTPLTSADQVKLARAIQRCQKDLIRLFLDIPVPGEGVEAFKDRIRNHNKTTEEATDFDADLVEGVLVHVRAIDEESFGDRDVRQTLDRIHRLERRLGDLSDQMVKSNLRLVVSTSKHFRNRGIPFGDLIQEGNIGLMKAVRRFDPNKGFRFSTYAIWWIRQVIQRAIEDTGRAIRVPSYMVEALNRYRRVTRCSEVSGETRPEEVMEKASVSQSQWVFLQNPIEEPVSLDMAMPSGRAKMVDMLPDLTTPSPWEATVRGELAGRLKTTFKALSPKEEMVVRERFGIDDGKEHTLEEIGRKLGISRERVRQIEKKALRKIRDQLSDLEEFREAV